MDQRNNTDNSANTDKSALLEAIVNHDNEKINSILSANHALVNQSLSLNYTPLELAVRSQNFAIVKILLEKGADPRKKLSNDQEKNIIDLGKEKGNEDIVTLLHEYQARIESSEEDLSDDDENQQRDENQQHIKDSLAVMLKYLEPNQPKPRITIIREEDHSSTLEKEEIPPNIHRRHSV